MNNFIIQRIQYFNKNIKAIFIYIELGVFKLYKCKKNIQQKN